MVGVVVFVLVLSRRHILCVELSLRPSWHLVSRVIVARVRSPLSGPLLSRCVDPMYTFSTSVHTAVTSRIRPDTLSNTRLPPTFSLGPSVRCAWQCLTDQLGAVLCYKLQEERSLQEDIRNRQVQTAHDVT